MQLKYGAYLFQVNGTLVSKRVETEQNEAGQPLTTTVTFAVQGTLTGDTQIALSQAEADLTSALLVPYRDLVLLRDDGGPSALALLNAGSLSGVRVVQGPNFESTQGPEYATLRTFSFVAQADYPAPGSGNFLVAFQETLQTSGGGPLKLILPALIGLPQEQILYANTPFVGSQQGSAIGYLSYPVPPGPVFPAQLKQAPRFGRVSPHRRGGLFINWEVNWSYEYESAVPLTALPSLWP